MHGEGVDWCAGDRTRGELKACAAAHWLCGQFASYFHLSYVANCTSDNHSWGGKLFSCMLFGAGLVSGAGELYEVYRGLRAGKDVVELVAEFGQRYLGKARKNQLHIGGFSAGVAGSALTGGCLP